MTEVEKAATEILIESKLVLIVCLLLAGFVSTTFLYFMYRIAYKINENKTWDNNEYDDKYEDEDINEMKKSKIISNKKEASELEKSLNNIKDEEK